MAKHNPFLNLVETSLELPLTNVFNLSWNEKFQNLVAGGEDKYEELTELGNDFVASASKYGKIIISELYLNYNEKTIKPLTIGGVMGGLKYCCQGIFFKFALDTEKGMYKGDQNAMKSAGHELKSLISITNCRIEGIHLPLMALIDYRGYRLICSTILPISKHTLKYGSADGGKTAFNESQVVSEKMELLAKVLNISEHKVLNVNIFGPGDIEGHIGTDERFYLIDLARLFPPETPKKVSPHTIWFQLLRPEFVRTLEIPLCSDTFSGWDKNDPRKKNHIKDVKTAVQHLHQHVIPEFAEKLDSIISNDSNSDLRISEMLHREGINCRHLGYVRNLCKEKIALQNLITEMVARALKVRIQSKLREEMKKLRLSEEEPYRILLVKEFNLILGCHKGSTYFWTQKVKTLVIEKFGHKALFEEEKSTTHDLRFSLVSSTLLFNKIFHLVGVKLTKKAKRDLFLNLEKSTTRFEFISNDIDKMFARVKHSNLIDFSASCSLVKKAYSLYEKKNGEAECLRMFKMANTKFKDAAASLSTNPEIFLKWGGLLLQMGEIWITKTVRLESVKDLKGNIFEQPSYIKAHKIMKKAGEVFSNALTLSDCFQSVYNSAKVYLLMAQTAEGVNQRLLYLCACELYLSIIKSKNQALRNFITPSFIFEYSCILRWSGVLGIYEAGRVLFEESARLIEKCMNFQMPQMENIFSSLDFTSKKLKDKLEAVSMLRASIYSQQILRKIVQRLIFDRTTELDFSNIFAMNTIIVEKLVEVENLSILRLNYCPYIDDRIFNIAKGFRDLEVLELEGCSITDFGVKLALMTQRLKVLNISKCLNVTNKSIEFLSASRTLSEISLRSCINVTNEGFELFNNGYNNLRRLDIRWTNAVTYETISQLKKNRTYLEILHTASPSFICKEGVDPSIVIEGDVVKFTKKFNFPLMVKSNAPIPRDIGIFYFEMKVLDEGEDNAIGIGLAQISHSLTGMPGWFVGSFGYHGDDGSKFTGEQMGQGSEYGPLYGKDDIVGLGWDQNSDCIFFTKNGKFLGVAFEHVSKVTKDKSFYPVIGSFTLNSSVSLNFTNNFVFDVKNYIKKK
eukprot:TRINITY_DN1798_c0_g1_i1.p1 TRINITY_DN1798_c0_g1~~TRINITY_DN1798_c0_g1_i1.p1  ORF type:complete len:1165 (-),score=271.99 TRINITY_DN1798_c0_g1_i1:41-3277(-)